MIAGNEKDNLSSRSDADVAYSFINLLAVLAKSARLLILAPICIGLFALIITSFIAPSYTAKTTFLPPSQSGAGVSALLGSLGAVGNIAGGAVGLKSSGEQYVAYLRSNTLLDQLIAKYDLQKRFGTKYLFQARQALIGRTQIQFVKTSGLISLDFTDVDPVFSAELANAYISELRIMLGKLAIQETQAKQNLLDEQITQATTKTYRSPIVRDAILQGLLREYETTSLDRQREEAFVSQVDIAQVPEYKSKPKRAFIAVLATLISGLTLLFFVLIRHGIKGAMEDPGSIKKLSEISAILKKQLSFKG